jgi:CheY-like chemotaxis protein
MEAACDQSKHVLVVDDQPIPCRILAKLLNSEDLRATWVTGGEAALSRLAESTPDLIILDLVMPGVDGLEVLRQIRNDRRTARVPVVIFSALSDAEARGRAMQAGATEYWVKAGLDYPDLRNQVMRLLATDC